MRFDIITIFPEAFASYFGSSLLKRAQANKAVLIRFHNPRDFTKDNHKTVDDKPYGGGPGMLMKFEPINRCLQSVLGRSRKTKQKTRVIVLSAKGKTLTQKKVRQLAGYQRLVLICGRYEGIDERVARYLADEELSIGNYVLTGGEVPAMVVVDAISRYVPGVLGKSVSADDESFSSEGVTEYPQYTRPEAVIIKTKSGKKKSLKVPKILLSGNHKKINAWRDSRRKLVKP